MMAGMTSRPAPLRPDYSAVRGSRASDCLVRLVCAQAMNDITRGPSIDTNASIAVRIDARPEPFNLHLARTAIVVADLQNGYASPGGYRELVGQDVSAARQVIDNTVRLLDAARVAGLTVILLKNGWDAELKSAGGPRSPNGLLLLRIL